MIDAVSLDELRGQLAQQAQAVAAALSSGDLDPDPLLELTQQLCNTIRQHLEALTTAGLVENSAEIKQLHELLTLLHNKALSRHDDIRQALLSLKRSTKVKQSYGKG